MSDVWVANPKPKPRRRPPSVPERQIRTLRPRYAVAATAPVLTENAPVVAATGQIGIVYFLVPENTIAEDVRGDLTKYPAQVIVIDCRLVGEDWALELSALLQQPKDGQTEPLYKAYVNHNVIHGHLASSFVIKTVGFAPPSLRGKKGGIYTLWGIHITTNRKVCGETSWNIGITRPLDGPLNITDVPSDIEFIEDNQIRIVLGPHDPAYMANLRSFAHDDGFLYYSFQTPLSREVVVEAIGPFLEFTAPKQNDWVVPQPTPLPPVFKAPTAKWPLIEHVSMKRKGGPNNIQKLLLYVGAKTHFRGKNKCFERKTKAVHKGVYKAKGNR